MPIRPGETGAEFRQRLRDERQAQRDAFEARSRERDRQAEAYRNTPQPGRRFGSQRVAADNSSSNNSDRSSNMAGEIFSLQDIMRMLNNGDITDRATAENLIYNHFLNNIGNTPEGARRNTQNLLNNLSDTYSFLGGTGSAPAGDGGGSGSGSGSDDGASAGDTSYIPPEVGAFLDDETAQQVGNILDPMSAFGREFITGFTPGGRSQLFDEFLAAQGVSSPYSERLFGMALNPLSTAFELDKLLRIADPQSQEDLPTFGGYLGQQGNLSFNDFLGNVPGQNEFISLIQGLLGTGGDSFSDAQRAAFGQTAQTDPQRVFNLALNAGGLSPFNPFANAFADIARRQFNMSLGQGSNPMDFLTNFANSGFSFFG